MAIPQCNLMGGSNLLGLHVADVFEAVFQHALPGGDLRAGIQVLHAAAAADTEVRQSGATRNDSVAVPAPPSPCHSSASNV